MLMCTRLSKNVAKRAVLEKDEGEPQELDADEDDETTLASAGNRRPVVPDTARERQEAEEGAGVGAEEAVAEGEPAGEAPEHPGAEPVGHDGDEDRGTRAGPAQQPAERDGRDAEDQEGAEGRERPARHARFPMKNTLVAATPIFPRSPK